jgi:acid phosphatase type 7
MRDKYDWIMVGGHRPYLDSDQDEYDSHSPTGQFITTFEPLFLKYGVDLVLNGHMHCYERTLPVINAKPVREYSSRLLCPVSRRLPAPTLVRDTY